MQQIEVEISESGIQRSANSEARFLAIVNSTQTGEAGVVKTLDTNRQSVDSQFAVLQKFSGIGGSRVCFQRYFNRG